MNLKSSSGVKLINIMVTVLLISNEQTKKINPNGLCEQPKTKK